MEDDNNEKWSPIIEEELGDISEFTALLPLSMKVAASTLGQDLVTVQPMSSSYDIASDDLDRIMNRIKRENRQSKIDSIFDEKEFIEKKLENDKEYNELMEKQGSGLLEYLDFKYVDSDDESDVTI